MKDFCLFKLSDSFNTLSLIEPLRDIIAKDASFIFLANSLVSVCNLEASFTLSNEELAEL
jgi:hypothetical protein